MIFILNFKLNYIKDCILKVKLLQEHPFYVAFEMLDIVSNVKLSLFNIVNSEVLCSTESLSLLVSKMKVLLESVDDWATCKETLAFIVLDVLPGGNNLKTDSFP